MSRTVMLAGVMFAVVIGTPNAGAAPAPPKPLPVPEALEKRHTFEAIEDPSLRMEDVLKALSQKLDVPIDLDAESFVREGTDLGQYEIAGRKIPQYKNVTLDFYLRKLLQRLPAEAAAAYWVRRDRIEVTTMRTVADRVWGPDYRGPRFPLVHAAIDKQPLADVAQELASRYELNAVIDPRAADRAKGAVSARLLNVPLDTALRLLADQAELEVFAIDNVFYVTTPERAALWKARLKKEREATDDPNETPLGRRLGTGPQGLPPVVGGPLQ